MQASVTTDSAMRVRDDSYNAPRPSVLVLGQLDGHLADGRAIVDEVGHAHHAPVVAREPGAAVPQARALGVNVDALPVRPGGRD
eukprot:3124216-Alexandrium_andersonii.AAC.1